MVLMLAPTVLDCSDPVLLSAAEISEISTGDGEISRLLDMRVSPRRLGFSIGRRQIEVLDRGVRDQDHLAGWVD